MKTLIPADIFEKESLTEESTSQLYEAINQLDDRSRDILQDRWLADEKITLHDLAEKYEISAERVRQIEKNAMKKLSSLLPQAHKVTFSKKPKSFVTRRRKNNIQPEECA